MSAFGTGSEALGHRRLRLSSRGSGEGCADGCCAGCDVGGGLLVEDAVGFELLGAAGAAGPGTFAEVLRASVSGVKSGRSG